MTGKRESFRDTFVPVSEQSWGISVGNDSTSQQITSAGAVSSDLHEEIQRLKLHNERLVRELSETNENLTKITSQRNALRSTMQTRIAQMRGPASVNGTISIRLKPDTDSVAVAQQLHKVLTATINQFASQDASFYIHLEEAHSNISEMGDWHTLSPAAKDKRLREMVDSASAKGWAGTPPPTTSSAQESSPITDEMRQQWLESAKSKMGIKS